MEMTATSKANKKNNTPQRKVIELVGVAGESLSKPRKTEESTTLPKEGRGAKWKRSSAKNTHRTHDAPKGKPVGKVEAYGPVRSRGKALEQAG